MLNTNHWFYSDLTKILRESRNEEELRHVWTEWHDRSGRPIKDSYARFVELSNSAAKLNGTLFPCINSDILFSYILILV